MSSNGTVHDPEDYFADTRMTFGDHLEELRQHLWRAFAGFGVALFFSFFIGKYAVDFITAPVKGQLRAFYNRRVEKTMKELQNDSNLQKANKPTGFTKAYFLRDQLQGALKGASRAELEKVKRPILHREETGTDEASILSRLVGRGGDPEQPAEDEEVVEEDALVPLWISYGEPLKAAG